MEANADLVPPKGAGSLYLRPLLIGSGSVLGVKPATEYTFLVYAVAVGPYFKVTLRTIRSPTRPYSLDIPSLGGSPIATM